MAANTKTCTQFGKSLGDLLDIIHFTEKVSAKIHGVLDKAEIYRIVNDEFAKSQQYSATIFLLTDDRSKLKLLQTSFPLWKFYLAEQLAKCRGEDFTIDLNKSNIYNQVVRTGSTVHVPIVDLLAELFPQQLGSQILETLQLENKCSLLTPLIRHGEIYGVFAISSTDLIEYFIPSVKNFAQHISTALELADDNSERQQLEEKLRKSEEKWHSLVNNAPNIIMMVDSDGAIQFINRTVTGLNTADAIGSKVYDHINPEYHNVVKEKINYVVQTGGVSSYIIKGAGPKGRVSWYETQLGPIFRDGQVIAVTLICSDITERKNLEKKIIQQEKLAAIGRFAAGAAHEINNPLDILLSKIECIQMEATNLNGMAEHLNEMKDQVLRISHITHSLLSHSKDLIVSFVALDINSLIENVLFMFRNLKSGKRVLIETNFAQHLPQIMGDSFELEKVFTNILNNAVDAIPRKGKISIVSKIADSDRIQLEFSDSGVGIQEEHLDKIFEPFFTTKEASKGTGLGLFLCRKIIKGHQGTIEVKSRVGEGTAITITLPSAKVLKGV